MNDNRIHNLLTPVRPLLDALSTAGGSPLLVGGAVRDVLLGHDSKDYDIEVHGLSVGQLQAILERIGRVDAVGRSFGVLKLRMPELGEIDLTVPQRRNTNPSGERGVLLEPDSNMTPREAAARRDFTWNAMALTPDGQLLDFFGGQEDLRQGVLRHVSEAFDEDPLRVLRAVQFAARFDMRLAPETAQRCRNLLSQAASLPLERVWGEWWKWAVRSQRPSAGLRVLEASGWLAHYPELAILQGCPQDAIWHPEGDVWVHTGFVCDAAAAIASRDRLSDDARAELIFASLCHDLGKPATTVVGIDGRVRSPKHATEGVEPARRLLERMGCWRRISDPVLPLVREHMAHLTTPNTARAVRRLAVRLTPSSISTWRRVVEADASGRPPLPADDPAAAIALLAARLGAAEGRPVAILTGRDLITAGYATGPALGELLRRAYAAQIDGEFSDHAGGLAWLERHR